MARRPPPKTPLLRDGRPDWLKQCTKLCGARCCRYVALPIEAPRTVRDFDDWRWYLSHEGISIYKAGNTWHICFETRCRNLLPDNRCDIYETRPAVCKEYDPGECEWQDPKSATSIEFHSPEDLAAWRAAKRRRR
ncbi:MAG: YkgJ family cysteine cluster protein [Planctomycetaceae bacterium]